MKCSLPDGVAAAVSCLNVFCVIGAVEVDVEIEVGFGFGVGDSTGALTGGTIAFVVGTKIFAGIDCCGLAFFLMTTAATAGTTVTIIVKPVINTMSMRCG